MDMYSSKYWSVVPSGFFSYGKLKSTVYTKTPPIMEGDKISKGEMQFTQQLYGIEYKTLLQETLKLLSLICNLNWPSISLTVHFNKGLAAAHKPYI